MANYFDQYDSVDTGGGGYAAPMEEEEERRRRQQQPNYFDRYDQPAAAAQQPPMQQQPQQQPQAAASAQPNYFDQYDPQPAQAAQSPVTPAEPEAEGMLATGLRAAAHSVLPTIASIPGFVGGAAAGLPLGPVGSIAGGLAGGAAAFAGGHALQESALKLMGFDDSHQQAVNARVNPWSATAGDLASAVVPFGAGPAKLATRAVGAVAGAGLEAGSEYLRDEELDPTRIATAAGAGALLTRPRAFADTLGAKTAQSIGRPELWHGAGSSDAAAGTAKEQPPPRVTPDDTPQPLGSGVDAPGVNVVAPPAGPRVTTVEPDPTIAAAIRGDPIRPRVTEVEAPPVAPGARVTEEPAPGYWGAKLDQEFPRVPPSVTEVEPTARAAEPPATPREAITQRAPEENVGGALRRFLQDERGGGRVPPGPRVIEGEGETARQPKFDAALAARGFTPEQIAQLTPEQTTAILQKRQGEVGSGPPGSQPGTPAEPLPRPAATGGFSKAALKARRAQREGKEPSGLTAEDYAAMDQELGLKPGEQPAVAPTAPELDPKLANRMLNQPAVLRSEAAKRGVTPEALKAQAQEAVAAPRAEAPLPAAEAPAPAQPARPAAPPPAAPPPAVLPAAAGAPPPTPPGPPPNVGQAAAAAGGTPPPPPTRGPTSMVYAPPQERSNLSNQWRNLKMLVGADIGPHGKTAENIIRGSYGDANRTFEQMVDLIAPHQATIHTMDPLERRAMINRMEGENRWPGYTPTPEQQQLINDNKAAMDLWKDRLGSLDRTKQMDFVENYLAHMYENPQQAQKFFGDFIKRGGAGSTKKRTLPTYEDAIEAGLKPFSDNPIEISTRYGMAMKNFIAANDALERGVETGVIGYFKPGQSIGASGSPEPLQVGGPPPGWKKLDAPSKNKYGLDAYAPEDFADRYNAFYDRGIQSGKPLYEALRNANSGWTQFELGLNSYHFFTMANEAVISDVARGLAQIMSGQVKEGATSILKSPLAPRTRYVEGKRFQQEYLDPNSTNPIASIMAEANARPIGRGHAADILGGQAHPTDVTPAARGSFIKNFSRDKINFELEKAWGDVKEDWGLADTVSKQALFSFKQASRALQTVGAPLFDKYIPALKSGAVHSQMEAWIQANPNVDIHTPEGRRLAVDAAQKIVDSTDNRFGEMIHDNLFMNQTLRQAAMVSMRSFSWTVGAMREIAGGVGAAGKAGALSIKNRENRFSMAHPEFDPRISYALAFPFVIGTTSAIYQYLKTGEAPQDVYDLYAPRTGGTVPGLGGKGEVPEHVLMPGFQKDVYGWLAHPGREGYAKLSGLTTTAIEQATNENWRGDPIYRRGADPMEHLQQRTAHFLSRVGPIGVKNFIKGQPETSGIPAWQTALGFRAPGADIQDPESLENWMREKSKREWAAKERHEKTEKKKYSRERVVGPRQYERVSPGD